MSEANKQLMRRWYEEVWNQQNESIIGTMFGEGRKSYGFPDADSVIVGPEAFKVSHRIFCRAFPDLHVTLEHVVAEGDLVAVHWSVVMTHTGDALGIPATGRKVNLSGSTFVVVQNGQILEGWNQMDFDHMLKQLQPTTV